MSMCTVHARVIDFARSEQTAPARLCLFPLFCALRPRDVWENCGRQLWALFSSRFLPFPPFSSLSLLGLQKIFVSKIPSRVPTTTLGPLLACSFALLLSYSPLLRRTFSFAPLLFKLKKKMLLCTILWKHHGWILKLRRDRINLRRCRYLLQKTNPKRRERYKYCM